MQLLLWLLAVASCANEATSDADSWGKLRRNTGGRRIFDLYGEDFSIDAKDQTARESEDVSVARPREENGSGRIREFRGFITGHFVRGAPKPPQPSVRNPCERRQMDTSLSEESSGEEEYNEGKSLRSSFSDLAQGSLEKKLDTRLDHPCCVVLRQQEAMNDRFRSSKRLRSTSAEEDEEDIGMILGDKPIQYETGYPWSLEDDETMAQESGEVTDYEDALTHAMKTTKDENSVSQSINKTTLEEWSVGMDPVILKALRKPSSLEEPVLKSRKEKAQKRPTIASVISKLRRNPAGQTREEEELVAFLSRLADYEDVIQEILRLDEEEERNRTSGRLHTLHDRNSTGMKSGTIHAEDFPPAEGESDFARAAKTERSNSRDAVTRESSIAVKGARNLEKRIDGPDLEVPRGYEVVEHARGERKKVGFGSRKEMDPCEEEEARSQRRSRKGHGKQSSRRRKVGEKSEKNLRRSGDSKVENVDNSTHVIDVLIDALEQAVVWTNVTTTERPSATSSAGNNVSMTSEPEQVTTSENTGGP